MRKRFAWMFTKFCFTNKFSQLWKLILKEVIFLLFCGGRAIELLTLTWGEVRQNQPRGESKKAENLSAYFMNLSKDWKPKIGFFENEMITFFGKIQGTGVTISERLFLALYKSGI